MKTLLRCLDTMYLLLLAFNIIDRRCLFLLSYYFPPVHKKKTSFTANCHGLKMYTQQRNNVALTNKKICCSDSVMLYSNHKKINKKNK